MFSVYPFPLWWLREYILCLISYHHQIGSMNCYPLFRIRSWNNGMRCMSFVFLMNLWYGRIASWNIRVMVVFLPRIWPFVTDMQHYYHARYLTDDWHLAYMFLLVYFPSKCAWKARFPILLAQGEIPASGSMHPSRWFPPREKTKSNRGDSALHLHQERGHLTDAWVCLHYWVEIWAAGYLNFHLYFTVYGVCHKPNTLWPYGRILFSIIIITQDSSQALNTYECL